MNPANLNTQPELVLSSLEVIGRLMADSSAEGDLSQSDIQTLSMLIEMLAKMAREG